MAKRQWKLFRSAEAIAQLGVYDKEQPTHMRLKRERKKKFSGAQVSSLTTSPRLGTAEAGGRMSRHVIAIISPGR